MEFRAVLEKHDLENYLDSQFEGNYKPEITYIELKDGEIILHFIME